MDLREWYGRRSIISAYGHFSVCGILINNVVCSDPFVQVKIGGNRSKLGVRIFRPHRLARVVSSRRNCTFDFDSFVYGRITCIRGNATLVRLFPLSCIYLSFSQPTADESSHSRPPTVAPEYTQSSCDGRDFTIGTTPRFRTLQ